MLRQKNLKGANRMKKLSIKIVSVILAVTMLFGTASAVGSAAAADIGETLTHVGVSVVDVIVKGLLSAINALIPDNKEFMKPNEYKNENFYEGTGSMLDEAAEDAVWQLGYAKASVVPDDWQEKDYYLGGFITLQNGMSNKVEEVIDDMQVRVIAVSDNSGRGVSVFANVDCIGMVNADIKTIRAKLEAMDLGVELNSVTVTSTHTHSCIDTQGLWSNLLPKLGGNLIKAYTGLGEMVTGTDAEYIEFLCTTAAETMAAAIKDMTDGTMTYATKDVNEEYFNNKNRKSASALMAEVSRFVFTPADEALDPTMIVNIAAHPDVAGLAVDEVDNGRDLSGDYVYYMGETIEKAGYNFMFFNGAIAGIYEGRGPSGDGVSTERRYESSARYGIEMANIALNLTNTYEEISVAADWDTINAEMAEGGDAYTLWFEGWEPVEEKQLAPILNVLIEPVKLTITNPLMKLVGKLNLANYEVIKQGYNYCIYTEIGYVEFDDVKVVLMPGEVVQDLVAGGDSLTAEGSYSGEDFATPSIYELFGEDTICFGLANDAIGYIVPDNDFSLAILDDHYQELISLGEGVSTDLMEGFVEIAKEVNR